MRISDWSSDVCSSDLDDRVISMSILRSGEAESIEERDAYLRYANAKRRSENGGEGGAGESGNGENGPNGGELSQQRLDELAEAEQFILPVADDGYGKRTSAYASRFTGRGGQGLGTPHPTPSCGREDGLVAAFPVAPDHQTLPVTERRNLLRTT